MEIGILDGGSPVNVRESSCDDIIVSSVRNVNCTFVNIDFVADVTSGHYDLLYKAEDIPEHVEADSLDSIPGTDSWTDLHQLLVMNMMPADQSDSRVDLRSAFGDTDINSEFLFPDGRFQEPRTKIRALSLWDWIPGGTRTSPAASTFTDNFCGDARVYADNSMPVGVSPFELRSQQPYNMGILHETNPASESVETSSYSMDIFDTVSTSPPRDDGSIETMAMRM